MRFLDILRRVYVNTPFLETLKATPAHLKFLRELLSKKGEPKGDQWSLLERCAE